MGQVITPPAEIEEERLEALKEYEPEHLAAIEPGSFGMHEALHTTSVVMEIVASHVMESPAIVKDPELYRLAHQAHENLFNLYQAIGNEHLRDPAHGIENLPS